MRLSSHVLFQRLTRHLTQAPDVPPAPPRILVVDDEPGIRAFLMRALSMVECEAVAAVNGPEAIQLFDRAAPIDLLLSDLMMPGMNGLELGRRLQQVSPDLKILYLTGYSDALFEERPMLGANEVYVDKPVSPTGLHQAISMALYGRIGGLIKRGRLTPPKPEALCQQTTWV